MASPDRTADKLEEEIVMSDSEWLERSEGYSVTDLNKTKSLSRPVSKSSRGSTLKRADAAWYVFDNLSCDQAEDLLRQHGEHGTYLVSHFHDPESYGLSIRISENEQVVFKHYAIGISGQEFHVEGIIGHFPTIEEIIQAVSKKLSQRLVPIFHKFNESTSDFSITLSSDWEAPPDYKQAEKFPAAARRSLPRIIPVYPTLRRIMNSASLSRGNRLSASGELPEEISPSEIPATEDRPRGCCWKAFHTDVHGKWWKPHKAGPVTAVFLVIGWILFIVLFGWIILLALILVAILICFSYCCNFICTGKCQVEDDEDQQEQAYITRHSGAAAPATSTPGRGRVLGSVRAEAGRAQLQAQGQNSNSNANRNSREGQ